MSDTRSCCIFHGPSSTFTNAAPSIGSRGGSYESSTLFGEHGLELEYDSIVVRFANVRQRLSTIVKEDTCPQRTSDELSSIAEELNREARNIDTALQDWTTQFPSTWCYQRHTLSDLHPWPMRDSYSPVVYSYSTPAYAAVLDQHSATRMLINSTRLRALELSRPNLDDFAYEHRLECLSHIEIMANDLASSVPFCLRGFKVTDSPNSSSHQDLINVEHERGYQAIFGWSDNMASDYRFEPWRCGCQARVVVQV